MRNIKGSLNKTDKLLLSAGRLIIIMVCLYAFLFWEIVQSLEVPLVAIMLIVIVGMLVLLFCTPIIYGTINNSSLVATGRYHIPLALFAILTPLFTVIFLTIDTSNFNVLTMILMSISYIISIGGIITYSYILSAIKRRIINSKDKYFSVSNLVFEVASVLLFYVALVVSQVVNMDMHYIIYFSSIFALLGFVCTYFATINYIPQLILVKTPPKMSLKELLINFYSVIKNKKNRLMTITYLLILISMIMFMLYMFDLSDIFSIKPMQFLLGLLVFGIAYLINEHLIGSRINEKNIFRVNIIVISLFIITCSYIIMEILLLNLDYQYTRALYFIVMAITGACSGIFRAIGKYQRQDMEINSTVSKGVIGNLFNLLILCGFSFAVIFACISTMIGYYMNVIFYGIIIGLLIASIVITALWKKNNGVPLLKIDNTVTQEVLRDITSEPTVDEKKDNQEVANDKN